MLVLAGNHGDEYEGQVAALRLIQELEPEQVSGRVTIIPVLSTAASKANTRMWPSGVNFNRSFPGSPDGPPNEQLADYLTASSSRRRTSMIDMHSGGRTPGSSLDHQGRSLHCNAVLAGALFQEYCVAETEINTKLTRQLLPIESDGYVPVPMEPGLGIDLDEDVFSSLRVEAR